ncbi:DUF5958 family protein [Streptomyces sp. NPDC001165]|uniref:DUF5958 family protein n=1 Tax=Streptomyces sp. NPDC001165 TaxID=3364546 RepID=UPI003695A06A
MSVVERCGRADDDLIDVDAFRLVDRVSDGVGDGRGIETTHTPAVLITRGPIDQQLGKIAGPTPVDERRKAFRLLIEVLAIADGRRRERFCSGGCGHWWHQLPAPDPARSVKSDGTS